MEIKELIRDLRSDAKWGHANEWETPITLGDHLNVSADVIEGLLAEAERQAAEIAAVTAERDALKERMRWIPVSERLPEESGYYLIACNNPHRGRQNGIDVSYYQHKAQNWKAAYNPCVTHWMPLPEAPKEAQS